MIWHEIYKNPPEDIDTLTITFQPDQPGDQFIGPCLPAFCCFIGPDWCGGVGGFGPTPLAAIRDLCENIARREGYRTDNGKLFLR